MSGTRYPGEYPHGSPSSEPDPQSGEQSHDRHLAGAAGYGQAPPPPERSSHHPSAYDPRRPGTVVAACVLTWLSCAAVGGASALMAIGAGSARVHQLLVQRFQSPYRDVSVDQIITYVVAVAVLMALWSLLSIVIAVLAYRRHNWARIALVVSAAIVAMISLWTIASGVTALSLVDAAAVIVLLFTPTANRWYAARHRLPQY